MMFRRPFLYRNADLTYFITISNRYKRPVRTDFGKKAGIFTPINFLDLGGGLFEAG